MYFPGEESFFESHGLLYTDLGELDTFADDMARLQPVISRLSRDASIASLAHVIRDLRRYLLGWRSYYGFSESPSVLRGLDQWIHRRLRSYAWKQWKTGTRRFQELRRLGVGKDLAAQTAGSRKSVWHISRSPALNFALPGRVLAELGVPFLLEQPVTKV